MLSFIADFSKTKKTDLYKIPRLDQLPYFISWPLVFILNKLKFKPSFFIFIGFICCLGICTLLFFGISHKTSSALIGLLIIKIIADHADGQMARCQNEETNMGALQDLISDFIFSVLLFSAIGYSLISHEQTHLVGTITLTLIALAGHFLSATTASFIFRWGQTPQKTFTEIESNFISYFEIDTILDQKHIATIKRMNRVYKYTWRFISTTLFRLPIWQDTLRKPALTRHFFAPFSLGLHFIALMLFLMFGWSLMTYLKYEVLCFVLTTALVIISTQSK